MAICPRDLVRGERVRLRAHQDGRRFGRDLGDAADTPGEVFGRGPRFAAALGEMFISNTILAEKLGEDHPIELRPTRTGNAPHIANEPDAVLPQKLKKIRELMPPVSDGIDGSIMFQL